MGVSFEERENYVALYDKKVNTLGPVKTLNPMTEQHTKCNQ